MSEAGQTSLKDLRNSKYGDSTQVAFQKSIFGGFNQKEVLQYIKELQERLRSAEHSFGERLEEYASMSAMLTQERDKYMKTTQKQEDEITELLQKIKEADAKCAEFTKVVPEAVSVQAYEDQNKMIDDLQKRLEAAQTLTEENGILREKLQRMETLMQEFDAMQEEMESCRRLREEYDLLSSDMQLIRQQYDEVMYEKSLLTAEKNLLQEKNIRYEQAAEETTRTIRTLRETNTKIKLKTRKIMAEYESGILECGESRKHNLALIDESLHQIQKLIAYENEDAAKLLRIAGMAEAFEPEITEQEE